VPFCHYYLCSSYIDKKYWSYLLSRCVWQGESSRSMSINTCPTFNLPDENLFRSVLLSVKINVMITFRYHPFFTCEGTIKSCMIEVINVCRKKKKRKKEREERFSFFFSTHRCACVYEPSKGNDNLHLLSVLLNKWEKKN